MIDAACFLLFYAEYRLHICLDLSRPATEACVSEILLLSIINQRLIFFVEKIASSWQHPLQFTDNCSCSFACIHFMKQ